jgi:uncharacterized protein YbjT (DUF2867 family)
MNILLLGASGFVGRALSRTLRAAGHEIRPISRRHGVNVSAFRQPQAWQPWLQGVDAVINAVGIITPGAGQHFDVLHTQVPQALFRACVQVGVRRVIQISALGTDERAFSAFHLSKRAADDALRGMDLDGFVLRPSLIHGRGGASAGLFMRMARWPRIPVLGDGGQAIQPVHISDVVAVVQACLVSPQPPQTVDVVGPQTFSMAQWLQTLRQAQGLGAAGVLPVPWPLALTAARMLGRLPPFYPLLTQDNLRMLRGGGGAGYSVDPLTALLGCPPRAWTPARLSLLDDEGEAA